MADPKPINLALQGGGAHGAYTWGVLDRLLQDDRVVIRAISGTSAGAMNAAAVADGLTAGGPDEARRRLAAFWRGISELAGIGPWLRAPSTVMGGGWSLDGSPTYWAFDFAKRALSPYQFNPLNVNPVRDTLAEQIDFERVRHCDRIGLFVSATNVRTGRIRVFERSELTPDAVMASAALPQVYQAVEIDGEAYWDGGFMGNPAIFPLIYETDCPDVVIVQINPVERPEVPTTPAEIANRVNEISFNSSLMRELRAISYVTDLLDKGELDPAKHKRIYVHRIAPADEMRAYGASSKFNPEYAFLAHLHDLGRRNAERWLDETVPSLGNSSTLSFET